MFIGHTDRYLKANPVPLPQSTGSQFMVYFRIKLVTCYDYGSQNAAWGEW